jgi:LPXTG-motif cell wall-anchored protein
MRKRAGIRAVLGIAAVCVTATIASAQTTSTTSETKKFTIISAEGNQVVAKLPEGTKELTVPDDFRFTVDGKQLTAAELKPGMTGTAVITTKTTVIPVTVTEVKNGEVMQALGTSILVRTAEGMKMFTQSDIDKRGVKIVRDGKPAQISDFRANDRISATIVTSRPPRVLTDREVQATLARANPSTAPAASASRSAAAPATAPSAETPKALPKTASSLPLLGLVGLASIAAGLAMTVRRRATR